MIMSLIKTFGRFVTERASKLASTRLIGAGLIGTGALEAGEPAIAGWTLAVYIASETVLKCFKLWLDRTHPVE